uniref:Engulfment and cell motility protein 3-like protein n=2 Tax=Callorhinchus milii TaxID=7868 RepID=V9KJD0_CALMI
MSGAYPQLIDLDQKKPLSTVLKEVCDVWNQSNPDQFAFQYVDEIQNYITETNRHEIKNGSILCLAKSPSRAAENLYTGIQNSIYDVRFDSLKELASLSRDVTFAQEFISKDGISVLVRIVESSSDTGESLTHTLKAFMELMEHGVVSWETLTHVFIKKIASFVNKAAMDASIQCLSLAVLESMVLSSSHLFQVVKNEITLDQLIAHLQVTNQLIQTKAMALIIALLLSSKAAEKKETMEYLNKKNLRQYVFKNIILSSNLLGDEMAHYLYVLQSISLNLLEPRMKIPMDPYNQEQRDMVHRLRQSAFENDTDNSGNNFATERRKSQYAKEFRRLGFSNNVNPALDFSHTPPGLLALDNMIFFATRHTDAFNRFVLENSSREDKHECPFARGSIQLTLILCEILKIGDPPSETGQDFYPMFFAQDRVFEEFFCICVQLLNKTWKEMRATQEDFDKVMQVVREQVTRTLATKPTSPELFRNKINALNYSEILRLRQTERMHQEETLAPPVLELRERLKPELMELIKQQRLNGLCEGTLFRKISSRRRQDKLWYCRLSPNHKVLHYGDVEEGTSNPAIESLQEKIPVADIKSLMTGKDCPHVKEKSALKQNREVLDLAFSILYDAEDCSLNFIAPSKYEFCVWTDGLNVLLGKELVSEQTKSELDILLSMEIKLRLLDLENIPIPDAPPPIPSAPSNYDFCYNDSLGEH